MHHLRGMWHQPDLALITSDSPSLSKGGPLPASLPHWQATPTPIPFCNHERWIIKSSPQSRGGEWRSTSGYYVVNKISCHRDKLFHAKRSIWWKCLCTKSWELLLFWMPGFSAMQMNECPQLQLPCSTRQAAFCTLTHISLFNPHNSLIKGMLRHDNSQLQTGRWNLLLTLTQLLHGRGRIRTQASWL